VEIEFARKEQIENESIRKGQSCPEKSIANYSKHLCEYRQNKRSEFSRRLPSQPQRNFSLLKPSQRESRKSHLKTERRTGKRKVRKTRVAGTTERSTKCMSEVETK